MKSIDLRLFSLYICATILIGVVAFVYNTAETGSFTTGSFNKPMTDLMAIIQSGNGNIKLEVTGEDLLMFSNQLISRAKHELSTAIAEARKEKYLTKEEVKKMCDVCDTTLGTGQRRTI